MSENPAEQVLSDLLVYLESMETQGAAILQLLKDKGIATEEEIVPYLEQASGASNVKWSAARLRMERLFALARQQEAKPSSEQRESVDKKEAQGKLQREEAKEEEEIREEKVEKREAPEEAKREEKDTKDAPKKVVSANEAKPKQAPPEKKAEPSQEQPPQASADTSPRPSKDKGTTAKGTRSGEAEERHSESTTPEKDAA